MSRGRKILVAVGALLALLVIGGAVALWIADEPRPEGTPGPEADALARRVMAAVEHEAWQKTGAVAWTFAGRHRHLWDRERQYIRVAWDDVEVLADLTSKRGVAHRGGQRLEAADAEDAVAAAIAFWANDAFWLNPIARFFDEGATRSVVKTEAGDALLISFGDVGHTPGDAYLWHLGPDGVPVRWQMWVSILPVGGLGATWAGWTTLPTGARISTEHTLAGFLPLALTDVRAAATLAELEGGDPFGPLVAELAK